MKRMIYLMLIFSGFAFAGNNWLTNFDEAKEIASKTNKNIMLYFSGSDWCRPCILLKKKVFEKDAFEKFANENLVLAMFDFPAREQNKLFDDQIEHNEKMAAMYNPDGNFPQIVIVNSDGKRIIEFIGYNNESAKDYITKLKNELSVKK